MAALLAKSGLCALAVFVLLGIVAPLLVDAHQDAALAGALFCLALALAIGGWAVREVLNDSRKIARARRHRVLPPQKDAPP